MQGDAAGGATAPTRSVTVNLAESPLGWLFARGLGEGATGAASNDVMGRRPDIREPKRFGAGG